MLQCRESPSVGPKKTNISKHVSLIIITSKITAKIMTLTMVVAMIMTSWDYDYDFDYDND